MSLTSQFASENNVMQQLLCKASLGSLFPLPVQGLPPQTPILWKGPFMQDPLRPKVASLRKPNTTSQLQTFTQTPIESPAVRPEVKALPLEWILNPSKSASLIDRVLARLVQLEAHEPNLHLKDDYRQSFITLTLASRGNTAPFIVASYQMYGLHPDKVWEKMQDRRRAMLGIDFEIDQLESARACGDASVTPAGAEKSPRKPITAPVSISERKKA